MNNRVPVVTTLLLAACHPTVNKDSGLEETDTGYLEAGWWDTDTTVPISPEPTTILTGMDGFGFAAASAITRSGERGVATWGRTTTSGLKGVALTTSPTEDAVDVSGDLTFVVEDPDDGYASISSVSTAADVTGDGQSDLVVSYYYPTQTAIFAGPVEPGIPFTDTDAVATVPSVEETESFTQAADLDGDGLDDLVVRTGHYDYGLYGFLGPFSGLRNSTDADFVMIYADGSGLVDGLVSDADLNSDGYADLVYSANSDAYQGPLVSDPLDDPGAVFVFYGPNLGTSTFEAYDALLYGESTDEVAGYGTGEALAAPGDMDGDGRPDLAIGAPHYYRDEPWSGAVYIAYGPFAGAMPLADNPTRWIGYEYQQNAGYYLTSAGDSDGDGLAELWVGSLPSFPSENAAWRIHDKGPGDHSLTHADVWIHDGYRDYGRQIVGGQDVNGDGRPDLLTGGDEVYLFSDP